MKSPDGLTVELPPMSDLRVTFGKLGVTNDSHVILYMTDEWVSQTIRIFLTRDAVRSTDGTRRPYIDHTWNRDSPSQPMFHP